MPKTLRLILGDQLHRGHSWFAEKNDAYHYAFFEMRQETDYVAHHIQKVMAFFAAMRAFAKELEQAGHRVHYFQLDDPQNQQSLTANLDVLMTKHGIERFEYQLPDEYRLDEQLKAFCEGLSIPSEAVDTEHFMSSREALAEHFRGKKTFVMESFYRQMRRRYDILMDGDDPLTGRWNYDAENRKKMPADHVPVVPLSFDKDLTAIYELIQQAGVKTIGRVDPKAFLWPIDREESLTLLDFFVKDCLPRFGDFQDAMTPHYWSLYHSRLSFSLNTKMLTPLEVVNKAIQAWEADPEVISISQLEGFIRQIIGWREYMRGIYWAKMPDYAQLNFLDHQRPLPDFFWSGKTKMACLSHAINQSLDYAYAHHIQRLMLTGNFALLAGIHPDEVDQWYLGIYIDAIEWVEITNTRGMSQFADGGIVGTKPYVSSANYVDKMSHYCKNCFYDKKAKTGPKACPFNSLYWHFYARHADKLARNPRIGMAYRTWHRMGEDKQKAILDQGDEILERLNEL